MPVTMRDVAKAAGVGVTTVSRVVNGAPHVHEHTRALVQATIDRLGFRPDPAARTLRPGQKTARLALLIEDMTNPFYAAVTHGVDAVARAHGYLVILGVTGRQFERERSMVEEMVRRRVDGVLIVPAADDHSGLRAIGDDVPMVFLDRRPRSLEADVVELANYEGARQAVEQLIEQGHVRIAYLGGETSFGSGRRRLAGYRKALTDNGIVPDPFLISRHNNTSAEASTAMDALLEDGRCTAVFADNNRMTVGALLALRRRGATVAVAGFDDIEMAEFVDLPLTVVTYDAAEIGRVGAELLFQRIQGDRSPMKRVMIPTVLRTEHSADQR